MENNILSVKNLTKKKGDKTILHNISFVVPQGVVCAFIGHNGAGKTTTIKSILNLFQYQNGEIDINGEKAKDVLLSHQHLGYVPEKDFFPRQSARRFLINLCEFYRLTRKQAQNQIKYYAQIFNFEKQLDINMQKLSSGQKKKVLIMQALMHKPKLIILDEPTENLDPDTRDIFYKVIKKHNNGGATIFISTHNLDEIKNYANYVVVLVNGQVKFQGALKKSIGIHKIYDKYKPQVKI